ncbi:MAG: bifunctional glutamate N-acetyltransferase/amino-acid acetyltransferase ArgJ [Ferrovibrio sp.]|uniref:bifunctional glutamate N-acetyltransferase/amino-acid acetyltransferase ArgJ n=1 Tax=Ferrovibrio sp. TaxID=1917215 RepID=UPI00260C7173|nr:bifunctional glutamate N-acetyltransferase/amino-acid acetyltransferase ArgJ [Ferrovibrio sp.]MCW0234467.1 bifunctional glutamate N-acetyltransferase/amino-acid acetyltransferase ArgJ [Ferrovibrio sp.]
MAAHPVSPLAPSAYPELPAVAGARFAAALSGMRYKGRDDLLLIEFATGTKVAGLFTRSSMPGAPVEWCRKILPNGAARALVVNAGIANVFTGKAGAQATKATADGAARAVGCKASEVYLASTGVIGQILPAEKIVAQMSKLKAGLKAEGWMTAARAIMTTDTFPKLATASCKIDGKTVTINGFCKGSGMIAPDMATMLAFIVTDAKLPADTLQALLKGANNQSFNCLTVDGDTSTSDTVLLFATGQAGNAPHAKASDKRLADFRRALAAVMSDLAQQIARDGEGAQKLVTIDVTGARSDASARIMARAIANSPLVKTAIAGADANWGRIIMAVGKSAEPANRDKLVIKIGGKAVTKNGMVRPDHDDAAATRHFQGRDVRIEVDVAVGKGAARVWTCDLTHGYIDINADYRS